MILIGRVYEIIPKMITARLKTITRKLVNEHQMDSIKGRQLDAAFLENELVYSRTKQQLLGSFINWTLRVFDHAN